ncbi:MAG: hypothetical protein ACT4OI_01555 [Methanobacteriota archaeon]
MKAWIAVLAFLFLVGVGLLLLAFLALLPLLIFLLGLAVFVTILAAIIVTGLILIVSVPYYFVTKRARVVPGGYTLEQAKER